MIGAGCGAGSALVSALAQSARPKEEFTAVKALVFDTFGTVVDWRTSVAQEVEQLAKKKGL
jgi:2-haloacid dehalogenase